MSRVGISTPSPSCAPSPSCGSGLGSEGTGFGLGSESRRANAPSPCSWSGTGSGLGIGALGIGAPSPCSSSPCSSPCSGPGGDRAPSGKQPRGSGASPVGQSPRSAPFRVTALLLTASLIALPLSLSGCGHFRTYTNFNYNKVGEKTETQKIKTPVYTTEIIKNDEDYYLKIQERQQCRELQLHILEETATIKTTAPLAWYYVGGGAVFASLSIPFYYMAGKAESSARTRNNALIGSFLFLLPGLAAIGFGLYQHLESGSTTKSLGVTSRTINEKTIHCGTAPAAFKEVHLGTRIGTQPVGKTDEHGKIKLPHRSIQPLIRHSFDKIEKVYLDVILENESLGEIDVPWEFTPPRE